MRDTSLRVPPGVQGTIVEVRVFNRHGVEKDERAQAIEREQIEQLAKDRDDELAILDRNVYAPSRRSADRQDAVDPGPKGFADVDDRRSPADDRGRRVREWWPSPRRRRQADGRDRGAMRKLDEAKKGLESRFLDKVEAAARRRTAARRDEDGQGLRRGEAQDPARRQDGRPPRQQGRGLAHRADRGHAVFLEDGPPVDIVLNPLGVPSRMNVGQILETHLGWACAGLGQAGRRGGQRLRKKLDPRRSAARHAADISTASRETDHRALDDERRRTRREPAPRRADRDAGLRRRARKDIVEMLEGRASTVGPGDALRRPHRRGVRPQGHGRLHLHAEAAPPRRRQDPRRSIGPYSLVTQQPLGGKAQFGGQRFGEMEVWALEAYGAPIRCRRC